MDTTSVVVIGAGPAGLAMSRCLGERSVDHVVLERADVANSWRTERWDSLRLLTPNWMSCLPGAPPEGVDADGYLTAREFVDYLDRYARRSAAPVVSTSSPPCRTSDRSGTSLTWTQRIGRSNPCAQRISGSPCWMTGRATISATVGIYKV